MVNVINEFCALLESHGAPVNPSEIVADDTVHRVRCALDKKKSTTIIYQLRDDGDSGVGWFRSFKHGYSVGITVKYYSKSPRKLSPDEMLAWRERMAELKKMQEARLAARWHRKGRLAARLTRCVERMPLADSHEYLKKKGVKAHGVKYRAKNKELIIPVYQPDGQAWSVQKIGSGGKYFCADSHVEGGFYVIGDADSATVYIAEGFATGATIYEVLGDGCVYVAFNAGNMPSVAKYVRKMRPDARIIVVADNDRFTVDAKGNYTNPGVTKATEAAGLVGGFVIVPDFPDDNRGTDWNDLRDAVGLEAMSQQLRDKLQRVSAAGAGGSSPLDVVSEVSATRPPIVVSGDWRDGLICDQHGKLVKTSLTNAVLFLTHHEDFSGIFKLNDFQKEIYVTRCPRWCNGADFHVHRLTDTDITHTSAELEKYGISCEPSKAVKAIAVVAEKQAFHPARDYFDSLIWDGEERLHRWLAYYMGAEGDEPDYLAFIGTKWLIAAVKRVYEPGCKFDHVLVMEGKQGRGKSTALEYMATFGDIEEAYFTDNIKITDIQNKDTILLLQGSIIVELAELAGFNKKDDEEIKGWITLKQDRCRKPYDRTITVFPRQFVLAATTNSYDYLKDPTGNRRYWPFSSSAVDLEAIKSDRRQLWAEAVHWYKTGYNLWPTDEEMALAEKAQNKRRTVDTWEQDVMKAAQSLELLKPSGFVTRDIFVEMEIPLRERDERASRRIGGILRQNGFESRVIKTGGESLRVWRRENAAF